MSRHGSGHFGGHFGGGFNRAYVSPSRAAYVSPSRAAYVSSPRTSLAHDWGYPRRGYYGGEWGYPRRGYYGGEWGYPRRGYYGGGWGYPGAWGYPIGLGLGVGLGLASELSTYPNEIVYNQTIAPSYTTIETDDSITTPYTSYQSPYNSSNYEIRELYEKLQEFKSLLQTYRNNNYDIDQNQLQGTLYCYYSCVILLNYLNKSNYTINVDQEDIAAYNAFAKGESKIIQWYNSNVSQNGGSDSSTLQETINNFNDCFESFKKSLNGFL